MQPGKPEMSSHTPRVTQHSGMTACPWGPLCRLRSSPRAQGASRHAASVFSTPLPRSPGLFFPKPCSPHIPEVSGQNLPRAMARGQTPPRGSRPGQQPGPEGPPSATQSGLPSLSPRAVLGAAVGREGTQGSASLTVPPTAGPGPECTLSLLPTGSLGRLLAAPQCPHLDRGESALLLPLAGLRLSSHQSLHGLTGPSSLQAQPDQAPRPRNLLRILGLCVLLGRHERLGQSQELRPWDLTCRQIQRKGGAGRRGWGCDFLLCQVRVFLKTSSSTKSQERGGEAALILWSPSSFPGYCRHPRPRLDRP